MKLSAKQLWEKEKTDRIAARPNDEITGRLEKWSYDATYNIYWGNIYGDVRNRFPDGGYIHTSYVDKVENDKVYTLNSIYQLGEPYKRNLDI